MTEEISGITTKEQAMQLLEELRSAGILKGESGVYILEEDAASEAEAAAASEPESEPETAPEPEPEPDWVNYQPDAPTTVDFSKTLFKSIAIAGGAYLAYRMIRRPYLGPIRL